jgi:hypothetical protein
MDRPSAASCQPLAQRVAREPPPAGHGRRRAWLSRWGAANKQAGSSWRAPSASRALRRSLHHRLRELRSRDAARRVSHADGAPTRGHGQPPGASVPLSRWRANATLTEVIRCRAFRRIKLIVDAGEFPPMRERSPDAGTANDQRPRRADPRAARGHRCRSRQDGRASRRRWRRRSTWSPPLRRSLGSCDPRDARSGVAPCATSQAGCATWPRSPDKTVGRGSAATVRDAARVAARAPRLRARSSCRSDTLVALVGT